MTGAPIGPIADAGTPARAVPTSAGAMLRAAREAAGMSIDTVAQQLKLAPRQVVALEGDDYAHLPGRTFVRGFVRNYARFVRIDPDRVVAALGSHDAHALDSPSLQATAPTMGELPAAEHGKPGWARWAIPLTLVAVIAAAAIYEFSRGRGDAQRAPTTPDAVLPPPAVAPAGPGTPSGPGTPASQEIAAASKSSTGGTTEIPLPNPVAGQATPGAGGPESAAAAQAAPPASAGAPATSNPAELAIVFTFNDASWTTVRDSGGHVIFSQMVRGGQSRTVAGVPPLDLVVGNASDVRVTWRNQSIDLAPYTRKGVARVVLQ